MNICFTSVWYTFLMNIQLKESLCQALVSAGFKELRPVQEQTFEAFQSGKDLYVQAKTGSGKTAAYLLPVLNEIEPFEKKLRAVIITPTRELALQVTKVSRQFTSGQVIRTACLIGGYEREDQEAVLKQSPEIIIATAGRFLELMKENLVRTEDLRTIILDEADQLLDLGQKDEVTEILSLLPKVRTALFSATLDETLESLLEENHLVLVFDEAGVNPVIRQHHIITEDPGASLSVILHRLPAETALVFFGFRSDCEKAYERLKAEGILAGNLTGAMNQKKRTAVINAVREGKIRVLCATDVAARGLDLPGISHVIHIGIPFAENDYIHRAGRSGHGAGTGVSILVLTKEEAESETGKTILLNSSPFILSEEPAADLSVPLEREKKDPSFREYYIRAGKQDGIRMKDIIGALCTIVPFEDIGTVTILKDHSTAQIRSCNNLPGRLKIKGTIRRIEPLKNESI